MKIDYDKAPSSEFTIACPKCSQKYKLNKPQVAVKSEVSAPKNKNGANEAQTKSIPCPQCKTQLRIDFSRIAKFPAIVTCKGCQTKIKLNDPSVDRNKQPGNEAKKSTTPIDKSLIDPKNNWAYTLYDYTRRINYLNKLTLMIYLSYLVRSIAKSLSQTSVQTIDAQSFLKLKAESNALSVNAANSVLNPILVENNINPRLLSWATSWFVKKLSNRIILNILEAKKVDMGLPYIKKYLDEVKAENNKLIRIITSSYVFALLILLLGLWANQKVYGMNGLSDLLLGLLFFVLIPYLLAKKANFKFVQQLLLSFTLVYVLIVLLEFINISTYRSAIIGVAESFFAITLIALVYELLLANKTNAIPVGLKSVIDRLDLKKITVILMVLVVLACVKVFVTSGSFTQETSENAQVEQDSVTNNQNSTASQAPVEEQVQPDSTAAPAEANSTPSTDVPRGEYSISDPDGYTNLRATPGGKIIRKVYENETFDIIEPGDPYSKIKLTDGTVGYIHNSRIAPAN